MKSHKISALAALLAVSTFALSACGDDEPAKKADSTATTDAPTDATDATTDPTDTTESTEGTDTAPTGDVTAPGTELAFGAPAVVPFESGDSKGTIEVTVTGITKGTAADLAPLNLGDRAKGYLPYYIKLDVKGVADSNALSNYSINESIEGTLPDGSEAQSISIIGTFAPCDGETFPSDFADGQSFSTCVPYLAQESSSVAGARFAPNDGPYSSYDGKPVLWK
jgi:hypothetical protein